MPTKLNQRPKAQNTTKQTQAHAGTKKHTPTTDLTTQSKEYAHQYPKTIEMHVNIASNQPPTRANAVDSKKVRTNPRTTPKESIIAIKTSPIATTTSEKQTTIERKKQKYVLDGKNTTTYVEKNSKDKTQKNCIRTYKLIHAKLDKM